MLTIEIDPQGTVVMAGRLDANQAVAAQTFLDGRNGTVTLSCGALEYLSSRGLGVLLKTHKRLLGEGGRLRLTQVSPHVMDIFKFSGFDKMLDIEAAAPL